jgi:hypothetical protein
MLAVVSFITILLIFTVVALGLYFGLRVAKII